MNVGGKLKVSLKKITLDDAKIIMLGILVEFDRICKKNNLKYWLEAGTLLGAVRHQGFIPWDDDIDLAMPRDDYEKFIKIYKNELPSHLFLQTKESDPKYSQYYAKIRDKNTRFVDYSEEGKDIKYHQGIFIDIFPLNSVNTIIHRMYPFLSDFGNIFSRNRSYIKYFDIDLYQYYLKTINSLHNSKNSFIKREPDQTPRMKTIEVKDIYPLQELVFEKYTFPAPANYDKHLTEMYGDYMTLPSVEERVAATHGNDIYIIQ